MLLEAVLFLSDPARNYIYNEEKTNELSRTIDFHYHSQNHFHI